MELLGFLFSFHKSVTEAPILFCLVLSGIRTTFKEMSLTSRNTLLAVHSISMLTKFQCLKNIKERTPDYFIGPWLQNPVMRPLHCQGQFKSILSLIPVLRDCLQQLLSP